jgi:hypothetical protein
MIGLKLFTNKYVGQACHGIELFTRTKNVKATDRSVNIAADRQYSRMLGSSLSYSLHIILVCTQAYILFCQTDKNRQTFFSVYLKHEPVTLRVCVVAFGLLC